MGRTCPRSPNGPGVSDGPCDRAVGWGDAAAEDAKAVLAALASSPDGPSGGATGEAGEASKRLAAVDPNAVHTHHVRVLAVLGRQLRSALPPRRSKRRNGPPSCSPLFPTPCGCPEPDSRPLSHSYGFAGRWSPRERGTIRCAFPRLHDGRGLLTERRTPWIPYPLPLTPYHRRSPRRRRSDRSGRIRRCRSLRTLPTIQRTIRESPRGTAVPGTTCDGAGRGVHPRPGIPSGMSEPVEPGNARAQCHHLAENLIPGERQEAPCPG